MEGCVRDYIIRYFPQVVTETMLYATAGLTFVHGLKVHKVR
jgi:hypothetical protein